LPPLLAELLVNVEASMESCIHSDCANRNPPFPVRDPVLDYEVIKSASPAWLLIDMILFKLRIDVR
jgi:hypothetical protein